MKTGIVVLLIFLALITVVGALAIEPVRSIIEKTITTPADTTMEEATGGRAEPVVNKQIKYDGTRDYFFVKIIGGNCGDGTAGEQCQIDAKVRNSVSSTGKMYVQCSILDASEHSWLSSVGAGRAGIDYYLGTGSNCKSNEPFTQTAKVSLNGQETVHVLFDVLVPNKPNSNTMYLYCAAYEQCSSSGNPMESDSARSALPITIQENPEDLINKCRYGLDVWLYNPQTGQYLGDNPIENCHRLGCENGECEECTNDPGCINEGDRQCADIPNGYRECEDNDDDMCLEWSGTKLCTDGKACEGGWCVKDCSPSHYEKFCYGNELRWRDFCGVTNDGITSCANGCTNGACLQCQPDCENKDCGNDGCNGNCGTCVGDSICVNNICEIEDSGECWEGFGLSERICANEYDLFECQQTGMVHLGCSGDKPYCVMEPGEGLLAFCKATQSDCIPNEQINKKNEGKVCCSGCPSESVNGICKPADQCVDGVPISGEEKICYWCTEDQQEKFEGVPKDQDCRAGTFKENKKPTCETCQPIGTKDLSGGLDCCTGCKYWWDKTCSVCEGAEISLKIKAYINPLDKGEWCINDSDTTNCYTRKQLIEIGSISDLKEYYDDSFWDSSSRSPFLDPADLMFLDELNPVCVYNRGDAQCESSGICLRAKDSSLDDYENNKAVFDEIKSFNKWHRDDPDTGEIEEFGVCTYKEQGGLSSIKRIVADMFDLDPDDPWVLGIMVGFVVLIIVGIGMLTKK